MSDRMIGYTFLALLVFAVTAHALSRAFPVTAQFVDDGEVTTCEESPAVHHDPKKRAWFC